MFGLMANRLRVAALVCMLSTGVVLADDVVIPQQPSDPVPAKAFGVFDQACAGCHQMGKLKNGRQAAGSLGNILDLAALARNPALVTPGNADASPLYTSMQSRAMPLDMPGDTAATEVTATELAAVRDWIEQLPVVQGCAERAPMTGAAIAATVSTAVQALDPTRAAKTRFISLVPLYNSCATDIELIGARQAGGAGRQFVVACAGAGSTGGGWRRKCHSAG